MPPTSLAPLVTLAALLSTGLFPAQAQEQREPLWQGDAAFLSFDEPGIYSVGLVRETATLHRLMREIVGLPEVADTYLLSEDGARVTIYWDPNDEQISDTGADGVERPSIDDTLGESALALAAVVIENGHGMSYFAGIGTAGVSYRTSFPEGYTFSVRTDLLSAPHHTWDATAIDLSAQEANGIRRTGILEIGSRGDLEITRFTTPDMEFIAVSDDEIIMRIGVVGHPPAGSTERAHGEGAVHCANRIFAERYGIAPDAVRAFADEENDEDRNGQWVAEYWQCLRD